MSYLFTLYHHYSQFTMKNCKPSFLLYARTLALTVNTKWHVSSCTRWFFAAQANVSFIFIWVLIMSAFYFYNMLESFNHVSCLSVTKQTIVLCWSNCFLPKRPLLDTWLFLPLHPKIHFQWAINNAKTTILYFIVML